MSVLLAVTWVLAVLSRGGSDSLLGHGRDFLSWWGCAAMSFSIFIIFPVPWFISGSYTHLILPLWDSQRGANKYGPSYKYPD